MRNVLIVVALMTSMGCTRADQPGGRIDFSAMRTRSAKAHGEHKAVTKRNRTPKKKTNAKSTPVDTAAAKSSPSQWSGRLGYMLDVMVS